MGALARRIPSSREGFSSHNRPIRRKIGTEIPIDSIYFSEVRLSSRREDVCRIQDSIPQSNFPEEIFEYIESDRAVSIIRKPRIARAVAKVSSKKAETTYGGEFRPSEAIPRTVYMSDGQSVAREPILRGIRSVSSQKQALL